MKIQVRYWTAVVVVMAAALGSTGLPAPAAAFDIFYFKDSGGDGIWNNIWHPVEICPGDGGEYMNTVFPAGVCRTTGIPAWSSALGVHTFATMNGMYPAGFWQARLYLRGTPPGATNIQVRLYREDGGAAPLCGGRVFLGMGSAALALINHTCTLVPVNIPLGPVALGNQRILALISTDRATTMQLCWNCAGAPSQVESTGFVAFAGDAGKPAPAESPGLESSTWGSIKSVYRAGD